MPIKDPSRKALSLCFVGYDGVSFTSDLNNLKTDSISLADHLAPDVVALAQ